MIKRSQQECVVLESAMVQINNTWICTGQKHLRGFYGFEKKTFTLHKTQTKNVQHTTPLAWQRHRVSTASDPPLESSRSTLYKKRPQSYWRRQPKKKKRQELWFERHYYAWQEVLHRVFSSSFLVLLHQTDRRACCKQRLSNVHSSSRLATSTIGGRWVRIILTGLADDVRKVGGSMAPGPDGLLHQLPETGPAGIGAVLVSVRHTSDHIANTWYHTHTHTCVITTHADAVEGCA